MKFQDLDKLNNDTLKDILEMATLAWRTSDEYGCDNETNLYYDYATYIAKLLAKRDVKITKIAQGA